MKKSGLAAATAALIFFQAALANGNGTGNISGYVSYASGSTEYFFFNTSDLTGSPACNVTGRFVIGSQVQDDRRDGDFGVLGWHAGHRRWDRRVRFVRQFRRRYQRGRRIHPSLT